MCRSVVYSINKYAGLPLAFSSLYVGDKKRDRDIETCGTYLKRVPEVSQGKARAVERGVNV